MEVKFTFSGKGGNKTHRQCMMLSGSLIRNEEVHIFTLDPKKFAIQFKNITGFGLNLIKVENEKNIYKAELTLTT